MKELFCGVYVKIECIIGDNYLPERIVDNHFEQDAFQVKNGDKERPVIKRCFQIFLFI